MVDGVPMCGQHATKASVRLGDDLVYRLVDWDGSCTEAWACPAETHVDGCYNHPAKYTNPEFWREAVERRETQP